MKDVYKSAKLLGRNSKQTIVSRQPKTYLIDEIDDITEEVSKVFDEMKDEYNLRTDEIEKPTSHKKE